LKERIIALGIDPGSKREGFTVKSESHTYLNIHAHAVDGNRIKKKLEARRNSSAEARQIALQVLATAKRELTEERAAEARFMISFWDEDLAVASALLAGQAKKGSA